MKFEDALDAANECHQVDEINNNFYSPFQGMKETYALQKGIESGFELGANWARNWTLTEDPVVVGLVEALEGLISSIKGDSMLEEPGPQKLGAGWAFIDEAEEVNKKLAKYHAAIERKESEK